MLEKKTQLMEDRDLQAVDCFQTTDRNLQVEVWVVDVLARAKML